MIEAMLFTSGRTIVIVPPDWTRGARFENFIVAWDGSGRAARAIGDAIPLLARAGQVEIVCVSHGASKTIPSTGLSAHLARHCKNVAVSNLQMHTVAIAGTLRAHAAITKADLMVMVGSPILER